MNFAAGASGLSWAWFTFRSVVGKGIWGEFCFGVGCTFTGSFGAASEHDFRIVGLLGAGAVTGTLRAWLPAEVRAGRGGGPT